MKKQKIDTQKNLGCDSDIADRFFEYNLIQDNCFI